MPTYNGSPTPCPPGQLSIYRPSFTVHRPAHHLAHTTHHTWAERLTVPNIALAILIFTCILPVHFTGWSAFAAANGQCMAFRREAYNAIGGHAAVRDNIVEDVALAAH
ncbi:MAG: glycosyltransferase [Chloroflexota bacterium]